MRLTLRNDGLGPAIIESNKVVDRNKQYDMISFFDEAYPKLREYGNFITVSDLNIGGVLPSSESVDLFSYQYDLKDENKINEYLNVSEPYQIPFDIYIEYSSMYEEKWIVRSNSEGHPKRLN